MDNLLFAFAPFIVDAVAVVVLVVFSILGIKKGFVNTFVSTFGTILSIIFAILLCGLTVQFLESKYSLVSNISESLKGTLTHMFGDKIMNTSIEDATNDSMASAGLTTWLISIVTSIKGDSAIDKTITLNQIISPVFGYYVCTAIGFIILFILFKIAFYILGVLFTRLREIKSIRGVDSVLGFLLGFVRGITLLSLLCLLIKVIPIGFVQSIYSYIEKSSLLNFVNNFNIFGILFDIISSPMVVVEFISKMLV